MCAMEKQKRNTLSCVVFILLSSTIYVRSWTNRKFSKNFTQLYQRTNSVKLERKNNNSVWMSNNMTKLKCVLYDKLYNYVLHHIVTPYVVCYQTSLMLPWKSKTRNEKIKSTRTNILFVVLFWIFIGCKKHKLQRLLFSRRKFVEKSKKVVFVFNF